MATPPHQRLKRSREEESNSTPNNFEDDDNSMRDSVSSTPQIMRINSLELEHKYDQDNTDLPSQAPPMKKQCQQQPQHLSVNVDSGLARSVASSPFMQLPSASLPTSLSASPWNGPMRFTHNSTFSSVSSSPVPLIAHDGSMFAAAQSSPFHSHDMSGNVHTPAREHHLNFSPHTPQISSMSLSSPAGNHSFPFAASSSNQGDYRPLESHSNSSASSSSLAPSTPVFRPASAPLHRPMVSVLIRPSELQTLNLTIAHELNRGTSDSMNEQNSPGSPIDATRPYEHVQHPSTPSRTGASPSRSSTYSMPHLQRNRSNGGSAADISQHVAQGLSIPSSLQSSHPNSPSGSASRGYAFPSHFRSSSPSQDRASHLTLSTTSFMTASRNAPSSMHTPTSSPIFAPDIPTPGVEIGLGILYVDRLQSNGITNHQMEGSYSHKRHELDQQQQATDGTSAMEE
jgi:hypothetical protein